MSDPARAQGYAVACMADLPESVVATLKALKTYGRLEKALVGFAASQREEKDGQAFEKKAKAVLLDGGMARSTALDLIGRWKNRPMSALEETGKESNQSTTKQNSVDQKSTVASETKAASDAKAQADKTASKNKERKQISDSGDGSDQAHASPLEAELAALAIRATSQESRFHTESISTASKEIDLKDVNLFVGERQLLNEAHVRIKEGVKYGLVGRNGTGKSTLLRALGDGLIPGLPPNVKILLVSQLGIEEMLRTLSSTASKELIVLDAVLQGDKERVRAEREVEVLSKAIDSRDAAELQRVVKSLWLDRAFRDLEEARRIATKRSGARGKQARTALIAAEKKYDVAKAGFPDYGVDCDWEQQAADLHAAALSVLDDSDAATVVPRAHSILHGLGFTDEMIDSPYVTLSGGWKSRCSLASALLLSNHILLLDEPINFLDLPSILWLEHFINQSSETVVTVAHDVEFLNVVSEELIVMKNKKLDYFDGNVADYVKTKRRQYKHATKQQDALDRKKELVEKSIQEGLKQARKTGDENRMRMVKSRQKKLDERWGLERNAAGHRFKLNRDLGGYHLTSRGGVDIEEEGPPVHYTFPDPDPLPFAASLLHLDNVAFQHKTAKEPLLKNVNITIDIGDRVGLVGPNGHGKLITGDRQPTSGNIQKHSRLRLAYYAQQAMADVAFQTSKQTALQHFIDHCTAAELAQEGRARAFLAQFDLKGRTVDAMPIGKLSGGQRVKLLLAEVVCCGPHLLILDEVTTHMDSESIKALIGALKVFRGAVILISHDRHAIKQVIEGKPLEEIESSDEEDDDSAFDDGQDPVSLNPSGTAPQRRTFLVRNGRVKSLDRGVEQYVESVGKSLEATLGQGQSAV